MIKNTERNIYWHFNTASTVKRNINYSIVYVFI